MVQISRIFRIFVSSTFSDMVAERNALQEKVFPKLRTLCASKGFQFQAIDLRWGVSQEAGLNQKAVSICMSEIERCQQATKRPNFLLLMGDRYGWQPLPETISATEFEIIEQRMAEDKHHLLNQWYWRDDNAVPAQYILQARRGDYEKYEVWSQVETELRTAIRNALVGVDWSEQQLIKYTTAVTEQEIIEGIFNNPNADDSASCFFRNIHTISDNADTSAFIEQDLEAQHKLQTLRTRLYQHVPDNIQEYDVSLSNKGISTDHIQQLCDDVEARLTEAILAEIDAFETIEPKVLERRTHHSFMLERTRHFVGRVDTLDSIHRYVNSDSNTTLVLHGESGIGKSSVMAQAIQLSGHTIFRFIGVTPASSNIVGLLTSICEEIVERYDSDIRIPPLYDDLLDILPDIFALPTKEQPLVLFLDALDQLTASQSPESLRWLAQMRSQHVKIIMSVIPSAYLDALQKGQGIAFIELKPLSQDNATSLLELWLADVGRKIQLKQRHEVLDKFSQNGLAIYLKLAFEEARLWHSYTDSFELATGVLSLIRGNLFARLSSAKEHGQMLVERCMSYLAASRYGLTENELLELLALDADYWKSFKKDAFHKPVGRQVPIVVWSRLELDLRAYMTERSEYGVTTYGFYHRQFTEAVDSIYLEPQRQVCHSHLANYFSSKDLYAGNIPNARKVSELPYQQAQANLKDDYLATLSHYSFIEAGLDVLGIQEFTGEYDLLEGDSLLHLIKSGLEVSAHVLAEHKDALGLQLRGRLGYHEGQDITLFLESIPRDNMLDPMNKAWLNPAGGTLLRIFEGHSGSVSGALQLQDGNILSWSEDSTLRLWQADGTAITTLEGHSSSVMGAMQLMNSNLLSWAGGEFTTRDDNSLRLWQADGTPMQTLGGHSDHVRGAMQLRDGNLLSWSNDNTLRLWQADGTVITTLVGHTDEVWSAMQLHDGNLLSWGRDNSLRLWQADGTPVTTLEGHSSYVRGVIQLADGNLLSWSNDNTLRLWQADRTAITTLEGHSDHVYGAIQLADGNLLSWGRDNTLRLWQADGTAITTLEGHPDDVYSAIQLSDGNILSWGRPDSNDSFYLGGMPHEPSSEDNTLRLWQSDGTAITFLEVHPISVRGAMQLAEGNLLSWSGGTTLRLWQSDGTAITTLEGHSRSVKGAMQLTDGNLLSWSSDATLRLWQSDGTAITTLEGHSDHVYGAIQLADGNLLSWSYRSLRLWDTDGKSITTLKGHSIKVKNAMQLANGNLLAWGRSRFLNLWDADGKPITKLKGHSSYMRGAIQLADGNLLSWCLDNTPLLWDIDGTLITSLEGHSDHVTGVIQLADGNLLSWSNDNTLRLWQADGTVITTLVGHTDEVWSVMQLHDGNLLSWGRDNSLRLWQADGTPVTTLEGHSSYVTGAMQLADGNLLSWGRDNSLRLWQANGTAITTLEGHSSSVMGAMQLMSSNLLSWAGSEFNRRDDNSLRLWQADGTPIQTLEGHSDDVRGAMQLRDGNILFYSRDRSLRLLGADGAPITALKGFLDYDISCLVPYDDGTKFLVGVGSGPAVFLKYQPEYL